MRSVIPILALAGAIFVIAGPKDIVAQSASRLASQSASLLAEEREDWLDLKESILQLANTMPADKYSYVPPLPTLVKGGAVDTGQESFGKRVLYIAVVNNRFLGMVTVKARLPEIDETDTKMTTKEASMKAVADSFDYGIAVLNEQTDQTMVQKVNAGFLGPSSRVRVFSYLRSHARAIDGQLALYLRMSGEKLPIFR